MINENSIQPIAAAKIVTTEAFPVIATQATDSPYVGVRTAAEQCACDRTYTVAEKRSCKTRLFKEVMVDNRRKVFMVSNMFCKNNKCNCT